MEKRVVKKCEDYILNFKDKIQKWIKENEISLNEKQNTNDFLKFIYDIDNIILTKDDFIKRKRVKNSVNQNERCCACRANGEQCTRRKQENLIFCGTHLKGTPHGTINIHEKILEITTKKIEVIIKEINGINYYIDTNNNIYKTEDVLMGKNDPAIIGNYIIDTNGSYFLQNY
jgi:hypothetical protein